MSLMLLFYIFFDHEIPNVAFFFTNNFIDNYMFPVTSKKEKKQHQLKILLVI